MKVGRSLAIAVSAAFVFGCSTPPPTLTFPVSAFPAVLTVDGRGNPPLIIEIGSLEVLRTSCPGGGQVAPGRAGVPALPWDLRVVTQGDGRVLLSTRVTELPKWLPIFGDEAGISSFPVAGPPGPSCSP